MPHSSAYKIQRRTNELALQQSEQYKRHRPETTLLYQLVERYYPDFIANLAEQGKYLPKHVQREFDDFLRCGRLEYGFLRVVCGDCKHEKLVAFSCKRRGFCPSCGARRMAESAALLVDDVLVKPEQAENLAQAINKAINYVLVDLTATAATLRSKHRIKTAYYPLLANCVCANIYVCVACFVSHTIVIARNKIYCAVRRVRIRFFHSPFLIAVTITGSYASNVRLFKII